MTLMATVSIMSVPSSLVDVDVLGFEELRQWLNRRGLEDEIHRKRALMDFLDVCEDFCGSQKCRRGSIVVI